ncbi:MAG: LEA type 2 family protein [Bacteroidia bacterium]|nr:LEA type 2 family protein [Bacteroidia bacterium]
MKKLFLQLILVFFSFSITSCTVKEVEFKEMKDIKLLTTTKDLIEAEVVATIYNPNWFGFRVKDNHLDLYMNDKKIGKAQLVRGFRVEGNSEKTYRFKVRAVPDGGNLLTSAVSFALGFSSKKQTVGIKGDLKVSVLGLGTNYKVDLKHTLN